MSVRWLLRSKKNRRKRYETCDDLAEKVGFEPTCPFGQPHFECKLGRFTAGLLWTIRAQNSLKYGISRNRHVEC